MQHTLAVTVIGDVTLMCNCCQFYTFDNDESYEFQNSPEFSRNKTDDLVREQDNSLSIILDKMNSKFEEDVVEGPMDMNLEEDILSDAVTGENVVKVVVER